MKRDKRFQDAGEETALCKKGHENTYRSYIEASVWDASP